MGVTRTRLQFEGQFTQVPNEWARDERLSRKARGLLVEIMSHRVGWHVSVSALQKAGSEGRDAIKSALVELKEHGYLRVSQGRGDRGRFGEVEYELHDPNTADGKSVRGGLSADGSTAGGSTASGQSAPKEHQSIEDDLEEDHPLELLSAVADDLPSRLDEIWGMWLPGRRATRKVVERALRTALKTHDWETIVTVAAEHLRVWVTWPAPDLQYVPLLSTWLNQERWTGAPPQPRGGGRLSAVDTGRAADALLSGLESPRLRALS